MMDRNKVAIYVRVSTQGQVDDGYSLDEQVDLLTNYCKLKEWTLYDVYVDPGVSGKNMHRPEIERLTRDAKRKLFDIVLIYDLKRLGRSQKENIVLVEDVFNPNGIRLVSFTENFDASTPVGKMVFGMLSAYAELDRANIAERMMMGKIGRAKAGKAMSWGMPPFAYDYNKETGDLELDEVKAPIVEMIYSEFLKGASVNKIVQKLNSMSYHGKNHEWKHHAVTVIIDNPVYCGMMKYMGQTYQAKHTPIIDKKTFELAQLERKKRLSKYHDADWLGPFQRKYIGSKICYCGLCGAHLKSEKDKKNKLTGIRSISFFCPNTRSRGTGECTNPRFKQSVLEGYILNEVAKLQQNPEKLKDIKPAEDNELHNKIATYEKKIKQNSSKLSKLNDLYLNDLITLDDLKQQSKSLLNENEFMEEQIKLLSATTREDELRKKIDTFLAFPDILTADYDTQKQAVELVISRVEATKEGIDIFFNF
ncbi:recombinase family protein [Streptococcus sp. ZY19097]|uniref:recombinase family protein n=1 Tax=Streptococcus sp. ZY19097 TaxID=3231906 RepID=UPI00345A3C11